MWFAIPEPGLTLENARRIYPGIKIEQARMILGQPEGDLRGHREKGMNGATAIWDSDTLMVSIFFDDDADGGASIAIIHGVDRCVSENGVLNLFEDRTIWQRLRDAMRF